MIQVSFDCLKLLVCRIAGPSVLVKSGRPFRLIETDPGLDGPDMDLVLLCSGSLFEFPGQVLLCHGNLIGWGYVFFSDIMGYLLSSFLHFGVLLTGIISDEDPVPTCSLY